MYDLNTLEKTCMVPACLYALIISLDGNMTMESDEAKFLKGLAITHRNSNIYNKETCQNLKGWNYALIDKLDRNDHTDIGTVNKPSNMHIENFGLFCFADYLKPGHHQKIIRDQVTDTFWIADFLVDHNTKDFYPDFI